MAKGKVTQGEIKLKVGRSSLSTSNLRGGRRFPIRHAKVTRVDAKRMVVDLLALAGNEIKMTNIPISFAAAGHRHFMGSIPEVGDICVVGQSPAESGRSKKFVILSWYVPSPSAGYDWMSTRSHSPSELSLTPANKVALQGEASQRRAKLRQIEPGNIVASSSQGSDLLLTESATLTNRRGNEIILRDQDQALIVRSLQQFHAGAGFRTYSGMIQRDANLLPTQLAQGIAVWDSDRQVDEEVNPLSPYELDLAEETGLYQGSEVFGGGFAATPETTPTSVLRRGLFLDANDDLIVGSMGATYGGKVMYRVCDDPTYSNGVVNADIPVFTEYRIEVAHTSDGTLPVTEQTDGLDINRLLKTAPGATPEAQTSPDAPMVEFVLGTVVGNDAFGDPAGYGVPLVAKIGAPDGSPQTVLRPYDSGTDSLGDQLAFLVRSKNPEDPTKESFIALSKNGAWLTNFQGEGSPVIQENLRTGKRSFLGTDKDGHSQTTTAKGTISTTSAAGRPSDNVGIELRCAEGAVEIFGGGASTAGASDGATNPEAPSNQQNALSLKSAKSILVEATDKIRITGANITNSASIVAVAASSSFNVTAGDAVSMSSKTLGVTVNGMSEYTYAGPKDSQSSNGPPRSVSFTGNPSTGLTGDAVDEYSVLFGGRSESFKMGRHDTLLAVGSFNVRTMTSGSPSSSPGAGFSLSTGPSGVNNVVEGSLTSLALTANGAGATAKVTATKGAVTVSGTAGTTLKSLATTTVKGSFVKVSATGSTSGGVLSDGCLDSLTGRMFSLSGSIGCTTFRVA